jgi:putative ABC transport system substrate-binding protein
VIHDNKSGGIKMKKTLLLPILMVVTLVAVGAIADAQQQKKAPRIGFLLAANFSSLTEAFRQGLHELGYVEGKNIVIEYRHAEGKLERLPELASELVRLKVDIIVVGGTTATAAAKQATSTIPIVVGSAGDLVGGGGWWPVSPDQAETSRGRRALLRT